MRALEPADVEQLHRCHPDHEFSVLDDVIYPTSVGAWEDVIKDLGKPSYAGVWLGIATQADGLIGYIALKRTQNEARTAEFGIAIAREHWNKGYGRNAIMIILRFAFTEMNLHRVNLGVVDYNQNARHLHETCGFREEGREVEALFREGRYCDRILMAILDREFFSRNPRIETRRTTI